jgi:poly(3-hydroxybutyrate) depolymerase
MSHCLIARNLFAVGLWTTLALASACAGAAQNDGEPIAGRDAIIYAPATMPAFGGRALVVVLHGGLGNAQSERFLSMHALADEGGFFVAYLNGTPVERMLGAEKLGWNAGNCCARRSNALGLNAPRIRRPLLLTRPCPECR